MRRLNSIFLFLFVFYYPLISQSTLINPTGDGGFENGSTFNANGWSSVNSSNAWAVGSSTFSAGTAGAYISTDGGATYGYTNTTSAVSHFYRDITVPAGESKITLSFKYKGDGDLFSGSYYDKILVYTAPTSFTPTNSSPSSPSTTLSGATLVFAQATNNVTTFTTVTVNLPSSLAGTTFRLIFTWHNDSSAGITGGAIDEVNLVSEVPGNFISAITGNWNAGATWVGGVAPTSLDNATIDAGHTVTINATGLAINNLTINNTGVLVYGSTPSSFSVNGNLIVDAGGTFNVFQGTTGKTLTVAGNITNDGTIDISVGTTTAGNLTLNGTTVQTIGGSGSFNTSVIRNLTCSNTNTSTPNIIWNFNNIKIANNLNLTGARIELNGNKFTHGNGAAVGTLTAPAGTGFLPGGKYARWWTNAQTGTTITAGSDPANTAGTALSRYPFLSSTGQNRAMYISRSSSSATGNTAGELAVVYTDAATMTTGLSIADGAYTITDRYNGNWTVTAEAGYVYVSGTHLVALQATNAYFPSNGNSRVMNASSVAGTHQNGTTTPGAQRTGLTTAQLTAGALYMGINEVDIPFLSVVSGEWNNPASWNKGIVPTCTDVVTILNGHNITVNSATNVSRNVTINAGGTLTVASGDLTVGCTLNNNTLANNGTLTVEGGTLTVNGNMVHNAGSTFNQSGGDINVDGNDNGNAGNSVASGVSIVQLNSQNINWTGGTLTLVDPHANTTASNTFAYTNSTAHVNVISGHTIRFGDGVSTQPGGNGTNGFRINPWAGSNRISFNNVIINGGAGTNRFVTSAWSFGINGDLTINMDGELRPGTIVYVNGNVTNNGTATLTSTLVMASFLSGSEAASTNAQSISGSGTFRNLVAAPTANLTSLTINNSNATGVTLNAPLTVSGTLTLTQGFVNTTSTNILRLGTATVAGTLSGGSATAYINGPFARTFPSSRTASGTYTVATLFPVGKSASAAYLPIHIDPTTTSGGSVIFSGEAFTSNSGTGAPGVSGLSNNRWEALITSGGSNFTSSNIRLNDANIVSTNKILQASSAAGTYGSIVPVSTYAAGSPNTLTTTGTQILAAAYNGYFAYGDLQDCVAPTDQPTVLLFSNLGTTTLTGSFTAALSSPSHYLVVRYPSGDSPVNPNNFSTYSVGNTLGTGNVRAVLTAPTVSFNDTGLTANTAYDYYVYSYNNVACNGPVYNLINPLMGTVVTCATTTGVPGTPTASAILSSSFTASWTASSTPGVNYLVDVATDAGFTSLLPGYNPLNVGMVLTTSIGGLSPNTTYYVRVSAEISGCFSVNSGTLIVTTLCNTTTIPYTQDFESTTIPNMPVCTSRENAGTGNQWVTANNPGSGFTTKCLQYGYNSTNPANAWFYTQGLNLTGGVTYRLTFNYGNNSTSFIEKLKVAYGSTPVNGSMTTQLLDFPTINQGALQNATVDFTPASTGVYYLGFNCYSAADQFNLYVDNISLALAPTDAVDWGNLQRPPNGTIFPQNTYVSYGQAWEPGVTDLTGQGAGLNAWVGWSNSNTDPATWPTGNWISAPFNVDAGNNNNDEFSGTFPANTFTPGTYYYAYRYQLNGGPFRYGAYSAGGGGFWDGTTYVNGVLTVNSCPSITPSATPSSICVGDESVLNVTSANTNYTYEWNPGLLSGAMHMVSPVATTQYTVTATDAGNGCVITANISVVVNVLPEGSITPSTPVSIDCGDIQELNAIVSTEAKDYIFSPSSGSFTPVIGGTDVNVIEADDVLSGTIPIGFDFVFETSAYNSVKASSNGFLTFNPTATSSASGNSASPASDILPFVAPLWEDLDGRATGGSQASYITEGIAPNRVFTMEWLNWEWNYQSTTPVISFQVKLYETSNKIEFVYRQESGAIVPGFSGGATIGIISSASNYLTLNGTGPTPDALDNVFTINLLSKPATGQIYAFEPPSAIDYEWSGPAGTIFTDMAATIPYTGQNISTVYVQPTTGGTNTYSVEIEGANGCKSTFNKDVEVGSCAIALNTKVFLTNVSSGTMTDVLRTLPTFPLTDPYTTAPYSTSGLFTYVPAQTPATTTQTILDNINVVDWVFVELRTGTSGSTTVAASKSGLLKNDGVIINPDGTPFSFSGVATGNYFIAIKHRNHCGFMTNGTFVVPNPSLLNLTDNSVTLYQSLQNPLQQKPSGEWAMWSGDAVISGFVNNGDVNAVRSMSGQTNLYTSRDLNLSGSVTNADVNIVRGNSGQRQWRIE